MTVIVLAPNVEEALLGVTISSPARSVGTWSLPFMRGLMHSERSGEVREWRSNGEQHSARCDRVDET